MKTTHYKFHASEVAFSDVASLETLRAEYLKAKDV